MNIFLIINFNLNFILFGFGCSFGSFWGPLLVHFFQFNLRVGSELVHVWCYFLGLFQVLLFLSQQFLIFILYQIAHFLSITQNSVISFFRLTSLFRQKNQSLQIRLQSLHIVIESLLIHISSSVVDRNSDGSGKSVVESSGSHLSQGESSP